MKRIPIKAAKDVGLTYGQDQVILITYSNKDNMTSVVTWGLSVKDCEEAAIDGNAYKKALGFPEEMCNSVPSRVKKKKIQSNV